MSSPQISVRIDHAPRRRRSGDVKMRKKSPTQLDREIAEALAKSAYFKIGDVVLMGKYKNKRGAIRGFGQDHWGNPTVEIEPTPKGRKQNKTIGLYKIWRADVKEGVLKKQSSPGQAEQAPHRRKVRGRKQA